MSIPATIKALFPPFFSRPFFRPSLPHPLPPFPRQVWRSTVMPNTHRRRDETVLLHRRRRCERNSQLACNECRRIQSKNLETDQTDSIALHYTILIDIDNFFSNDVTMSSLLKKVINIYQNSHSQTAMESVWPVFKLSIESVRSRRELVANCVHTADATKQFRRVGVGGVYWA